MKKLTDERLIEYIDDFHTDSSYSLEEFRLSCENEHIPIIRRDAESFLKNILMIRKPLDILEIGTGAGYSSTVFALTCEQAHITTIEMIEKRIKSAKSNFSKYGVSNRINLIEGDASEAICLITNNRYDFVFIDCAKSRYREFFQGVAGTTKPGSIIVCDNVFLDGRTISDEYIEKRRDRTSPVRMREFLSYLKDYKNAETSLLNIGDGLTFSIIK